MRTTRFFAVLLPLLAAAGCGSTHKAAASPRPTSTSTRVTASAATDRYEAMCHAKPKKYRYNGIEGGPWKPATASTFYIGEEANASNANISNISTAWSDFAVSDFGGVDSWGPLDPTNWDGPWYERNGLCPEGFQAKENPFYVALPTPDHTSHPLKAAEKWARIGARYLPELRRFHHGHFRDNQSPFKNLWVEVVFQGRAAFGQLEDVGPSNFTGKNAADYRYVWGKSSNARNKFGLHAGADISPATTDYLGTHGDGKVRWRFVPKKQVPDGPWKVTVTTSGPHWKQ
jgi:hypothetical protein